MNRLVEEFIAALEESDKQTRTKRAERAAWLTCLGWPESGWVLFGSGVMPAWEELRRTFIDGSFLATILIGQAFLENLLAGQLSFVLDERLDRPQISDVLRRTLDLGWLAPEEFAALDAIRGMRNPHAHYRHLLDDDSLTSCAMSSGETPDAILEQDTRAVVKALHRLVNRPPFALGLILYPNDEEPAVHPDQMHLPI